MSEIKPESQPSPSGDVMDYKQEALNLVLDLEGWSTNEKIEIVIKRLRSHDANLQADIELLRAERANYRNMLIDKLGGNRETDVVVELIESLQQRTKLKEQYKNLEFAEVPYLGELRVYGHGDSGYLRFMGESADLVRTMRDILTAKVSGQAEQRLKATQQKLIDASKDAISGMERIVRIVEAYMNQGSSFARMDANPTIAEMYASTHPVSNLRIAVSEAEAALQESPSDK